jgi:tRNA dimethylallyltransferase
MSLARRLPGIELVAVDSMQVYRGMDIGTAKPTPAEQAEARHHAIDFADPSEEVTVVRYAAEARAALADIEGRGRRAVLVGGTGLYLRALVDGLEPPGTWPAIRAELEAAADPAQRGAGTLHARLAALDPPAAAKIEPSNTRRLVRALEVTLGSGRPFSSYGPGLDHYPPNPVVQIALRWPRALLAERIERRYREQLELGFLAEVEQLAARPGGLSRTARQALGYKELLAHVDGRCSLDEALDLAITRTRRFAARQERWFRRDPRLRWIDVDGDSTGPLALVDELAREVERCA